MLRSGSTMLQIQLEDCLHDGDSSSLVSLLLKDGLSPFTLTGLHQLVTKELGGAEPSRVSVVLTSLGILTKNKNHLETLIDLGLTYKLLLWFEMVRDLLRGSAPLLSLIEEFFDYFLVLVQAPLPVSQLSVVLLHLIQFTLETRIHFPLRLEAIRTFNSILESLSREQRRTIQNQHQRNIPLFQIAEAVLSVGDYELQISLSEALCRLTPRRQRQQRANQWFSSEISSAFCDIRDADFEVDGRRFLNFVNSHHGDERRVYTFPCLRAFLNSTQLFRPNDDKLQEFWIDFNVGSQCVSFFINEPQGFLWGTIHLLRDDVMFYNLKEENEETSLRVHLKSPIMHQNIKGSVVTLSFNRKYNQQLQEAAGRALPVTMVTNDLTHDLTLMMSSSRQCPTEEGGASKQVSLTYRRKKTRSKSQLKVLPLSSPSSEDDSVSIVMITNKQEFDSRSRAERLFDQIRNSTPVISRVSQWEEPVISQPISSQPISFQPISSQPISFQPISSQPISSQPISSQPISFQPQDTELEELPLSPIRKEESRKRSFPDSGYLSDQLEATVAVKKKVEPEPQWVEPEPQWVELEPQWEEPVDGLKESLVEGAEPTSAPTSDISAVFETFQSELENHLTYGWRTVEDDVTSCLKECQQNVTSLLKAVNQRRSVSLQNFHSTVSDQLKQLQRNMFDLNSINTHILSFFQSETKRFTSFCSEIHQRLSSLDREESGAEPLNQSE